MLFGPLAVNVVAFGAEVFVVPAAKADQDFISPRPKPVVRGPTAEASRLGIHRNVTKGRGSPFGHAQRHAFALFSKVRLHRVETSDRNIAGHVEQAGLGARDDGRAR